MKSKTDKSFNYNKGQRRAIFLLITLLMLLIIIRFNWKYNNVDDFDYSSVALYIDNFINSVDSSQTQFESNYKPYSAEKINVQLKPFNPNATSYEGFLALGLAPYQAKSILKYLASGAQFYKKTDLKKIYTLKESDYTRLEPYIILPESETVYNSKFPTKESKPVVIVELNSASHEQLLEVRGIGPVIAKNILKYRSMIGGFYSVEQLREVYGVDSTVFIKIENSFVLDTDSIKRININKTSYYDLRKHPYLTNQQAFEISNHVKYSGPFKKLSDLLQIPSIKEKDFERIKYYLDIK
jgi:competence protein ComEA